MSQLTFLADVSLNQETLESGIENEQNNKTKNTRGANKEYKFDQECLTKSEAEEILKKEKIWSCPRPRKSKEGTKLFYRCNKVACLLA